MPRSILALLLVAAALGAGCQPRVNLGAGQGDKYAKKAGKAITDFENKVGNSKAEEILAALEGAPPEPKLRLQAARLLYRQKDYASAVAQLDVALDHSGKLPRANGYRASFMWSMYALRAASEIKKGNVDEAAKSLDECLSYPELLNCHEPAAYVSALRGDADAFLSHLGAVWRHAPGADLSALVNLGAAKFPDRRPALRDLVRDAWEPRWSDHVGNAARTLLLAQLQVAAGEAEAARELFGRDLHPAFYGAWYGEDDTVLHAGDRRGIVTAVAWGSPAHAAGLRPCDRVVAYGGHATPTSMDLDFERARVRASAGAGAVVPLRVERGGQALDLRVVLGENSGLEAGSGVEFAVCEEHLLDNAGLY